MEKNGISSQKRNVFAIEYQTHSLALDDLCQTLGTNIRDGVTNSTAKSLLKIHGYNKLSRPKTTRNSESIVNKLLCGTSKTDWSKKDWDRVINSRFDKSYCVIRDSIRTNIKGRNLVKGDIVHLESGQIVPADIRVFQFEGCLAVDNRIITGNSSEIKSNLLTNVDPLLSENMLFAGTELLSGKCIGIVITTGDDTIFGTLSKVAQKVLLTRRYRSSASGCFYQSASTKIVGCSQNKYDS